VSFRAPFANTPSTITLSAIARSTNYSGTPTVVYATYLGFAFSFTLSVGDMATVYWFGNYFASA
jgi:hypothetical protein